MKRKYLSRYEKRKKKQKVDALIQSQAGALDKFLTTSQKQSSSMGEEEHGDSGNEQENLGNKED